MKIKFVLLLCLLSLSACTGRLYSVPQPDFDPQKYEVVGEARETATGLNLFNFIPINLNNKIQRAVEEAIRSRSGDVITNLRVRERWFWAYVLNGYKIDIEGTVLREKKTNSK